MRLTGTEAEALTREEERALHSIMTISAVIFIAMVMLVFAVLASPSLSPVEAVADWDGDGYSNVRDAFPRDPSEWVDTDRDGVGDNSDVFPTDPDEAKDSDSDGVGDNADFFDEGDGWLTITLDAFEYLGSQDSNVQTMYYPNPLFKIYVDVDNNGYYDVRKASETFYSATLLVDFFSVTLNVDDRTEFVRFTIFVYDARNVTASNVTDYEVIDCSPLVDVDTVELVTKLPCRESLYSDGREDGDTPDCSLEYSVATISAP